MATIRANRQGARLVEIADRTYVGEGTIIGGPDNPTWDKQYGDLPSYIGFDCSIGNHCTISENVMIADRVKIGNNVVIRSGVRLSDDCVIGHGTVFEGEATVGKDTLIHSQCHITRGAKIGSKVFIAPYFVGANDPLCMRRKFMPGNPEFIPVPYVIEDGVRIGIGAIILPGVRIGKNAQIAAGAIVTRDVEPGTLIMGVPGRLKYILPDERLVCHEARN